MLQVSANRSQVPGKTRIKLQLVFMVAVLLIGTCATVPSLHAQMVVVELPWVNYSEAYQEFFHTHWGLSWTGPGGGFFFHQGSDAPWLPFGTPIPAAHIGWGGRVGPLRYHAHISAAQASHRSLEVVVPSLTLMNGYPGYLIDARYRPFVVQTVPVVFGWQSPPPWLQRLEQLRSEQKSSEALIVPPISNERPTGIGDDPPVRITPPPSREDDPPLRLGRKEP